MPNKHDVKEHGFLTVVVLRLIFRPAAYASPGNLLEILILKAHPRPTELETLGMGPSNLCFNKTPRDSTAAQVEELRLCYIMQTNNYLSPS